MNPYTFTLYDALNTPHDVTPDVLRVVWRMGFVRAYNSVAKPAHARLTLNNIQRIHSPELNPLWQIGNRVQITHNDGVTVRVLFTGWVHSIEPLAGDLGRRQTVVELGCGLAELAQMMIYTPLLTHARTDEIIAAVLARPPLGRYVQSLQSGDMVFAFAGDRWGESVSALRAIRQAVSAERGRFFSARDGTLTFLNRATAQQRFTPAVTFTDQADALDYRYGDALATVVRVSLIPREIGVAGSPLWTLTGAQKIPANGEHELLVSYRNADGRAIGALNVITPVAGTDFNTNTAPDGTGTITTLLFNMSVLSADGSSARLLLTNDYHQPVYLLPGAQLRGTPLIHGTPAFVERGHTPSMTAHGVRTLTLSLPLLDSVESAAQIARYELRRRRTPRGTVYRLTLSQRTAYPHILARTLFDCVRIIETQTGFEADALIIGEAHDISNGGRTHRVTWTLEPCNTVPYWQLNAGKLNDTTELGY